MKMDERPVLAVLAGDANLDSRYIRSLLVTARQAGFIAYSFSPHMWQRGEAARAEMGPPTPTVVYNRLPTRRDEVSDASLRVKNALRQEHIPYFNARFVNKREIDQILRNHDETVEYLPETVYTATEAHALRFLERFPAVFLKPVSGSFGEGICRISRDGDRYVFAVRRAGVTFTKAFGDLSDALAACRAQMGGMSCLLQEEIPLKRYDGCKTDFRVHMQRGGGARWHTVAIGAKVAHPSGITTHVHSGGRVESGDVVLARWFGDRSGDARERIEEAAASICRRVADSIDPRLGELGLDMGIATDGRIVVFEANSKPGRAIFRHPALRSAGEVSRRMIVRYAEYLHRTHESVAAALGVTSDGS